MRHPRFITAIRESYANPQAWWDNEARKTGEMEDGALGYEQLQRNQRDRERSMPSYVTVYAEVIVVAAAVVVRLWWLVAG